MVMVRVRDKVRDFVRANCGSKEMSSESFEGYVLHLTKGS